VRDVVVVNKIDKVGEEQRGSVGRVLRDLLLLSGKETDEKTKNVFEVSCVTGEGISELEDCLSLTVKSLLELGQEQQQEESPMITRERHRFHVDNCIHHLDRFLTVKLPADLAAEEIRLSMLELGKVLLLLLFLL
jgi:tRNA U34 5-carboxymethylaminomethyl modifying GTPase MnmE/TrmE